MSKRILVVVDMQNDFISGCLKAYNAENILSSVKDKILSYQKNNDLIFYTKDTHDDNYLTTQEGKNLPVPHCIKNTEGWEIPKDLLVNKNIIEKKSFGFYDWKEVIGSIIKNDEIISIELIGICTDICVISNALVIKAAYPEIEIIVDSSCCAGVTNESHHQALEAMKMCQIKVY